MDATQTHVGGARAAYEHIAPYYDRFTAHHDYDLWLGNLLNAAAGFGLRGDRLLDVACGTGKSFLPMLKRGWSVTAIDLSPAMIDLAASKVDDSVDLVVADMRSMPRLGSFDLVWCLDDALNYLRDVEQLESALRAMAANLAPHGLLLFDTNTLHTYRTFFAQTQTHHVDNVQLTWRGLTSTEAEATIVAEAIFEVVDGDGEVTAAVHRQRHFTEVEIGAGLQAAGLRLLATHGHGFDAVLEQPLAELRHTKAVYIACPR